MDRRTNETTLSCSQCPQSAHAVAHDGYMYCVAHYTNTRLDALVERLFGKK